MFVLRLPAGLPLAPYFNLRHELPCASQNYQALHGLIAPNR